MAYSKLTPTKLAEHFGITPPNMRKALIDSGLLDEFFNAPTAEGHLLAGAELHEGNGEYPSLFHVWDLALIEALFPALGEGSEDRRFATWPNRWKAAEALESAGGLLQDELGEEDPDVLWLCFKNFALVGCDTAPDRKRFATSTLEPLIERIKATAKKKRKGKRTDVVLALKMIEGVRTWCLGKRPKVDLEIDKFLKIEPEQVDRDAEPGSFMISEQELTLLETGYVISPPYADTPLECFAELAVAESLRGRKAYSPKFAHLRMVEIDSYNILLFRTLDKEEKAYVDAAWHVEIDEDNRLNFMSPCKDVPEIHFAQMMHHTANRHPKLSRYIRESDAECAKLRTQLDGLKAELRALDARIGKRLPGLPAPQSSTIATSTSRG